MVRSLDFASPHLLLGLQKIPSQLCKGLYIMEHFLYLVMMSPIQLMPHVLVRSHQPASYDFELDV